MIKEIWLLFFCSKSIFTRIIWQELFAIWKTFHAIWKTFHAKNKKGAKKNTNTIMKALACVKLLSFVIPNPIAFYI